jgi:hypothetical protein
MSIAYVTYEYRVRHDASTAAVIYYIRIHRQTHTTHTHTQYVHLYIRTHTHTHTHTHLACDMQRDAACAYRDLKQVVYEA